MRPPLPAPAVAIALLAAAVVGLSTLQLAAAFIVVPPAGPFTPAAAMQQQPPQEEGQQPPSRRPDIALAASSTTAGGGDSGGIDPRQAKPASFPPSPPSRRIREVCTAVVRDPTTGRFLALKRSKEVRSFQGHWHFISGGMELGDKGDPVRRAYRELEEEVQLLPEHVTLVARGRPLLVAPPRPGNKAILVHPILFDLVQPYQGPVLDRAVLNWENDDARWAALADLEGLPTVPRLMETAQRLLAVAERRTQYEDGDDSDEIIGAASGDDGAWPPPVRAALQAIRDDRTHGAMQLMGWAVEAVGTWARVNLEEIEEGSGQASSSSLSSVHALQEELKDLSYTLCQIRPSMAALANGVMHVLNTALAAPSSPPPAAFLQTVADAAAGFVGTDVPERNERLTEAAVRALLALAAERGGVEQGEFTVITLSLSSTLMAVFWGFQEQWGRQEGGRRLRVIVCESRPLYEGARAAAALADMGFQVTLITEAQMGLFASSAHAALLGADAVLGNIDTPAPFPSPPLPAFLPPVVINKAGSYPLALCCHHANVPVLVVSSDLKITDQSLFAFELEAMSAEEVVDGPVGALLGAAKDRVQVTNIYFEPVPLLLPTTHAATADLQTPAPLLVSVLVTEEGATDGGQAIPMVMQRAEERRGRYERLFFG